MKNYMKLASSVAAGALALLPMAAFAQTMTGVALGAPALADAATGAQNVLNVGSETVASNVQFYLLIAAVGVGIFVVRYIMHRFTRIHKG